MASEDIPSDAHCRIVNTAPHPLPVMSTVDL